MTQRPLRVPGARLGGLFVDVGVLRQRGLHERGGERFPREVHEGRLPSEHSHSRSHDDGGDSTGARDGNQRRPGVIPVDHTEGRIHQATDGCVVRGGLVLDVDNADGRIRVDESCGDDLASSVDDARPRGHGDVGADGLHLALRQDDRRVLDRRVGSGDLHARVGDGDIGRVVGARHSGARETGEEDRQANALHFVSLFGVPRTPSSKSLHGAPTCPRSKTSCPST